MNILLTGSTGFIGSALLEELKDYNLFTATRSEQLAVKNEIRSIKIDNLEQEKWSNKLDSIDIVIHLAGRAHIFKDKSVDPLKEFRKVNCVGTQNLIDASISSGVKRFIYISSVGVGGSVTKHTPLSEDIEAKPVANYAISKYEAEDIVISGCERSEMDYVIIRPPLVFSEDAPGNFGKLLRICKRTIPLPFKGVSNKRSIIFLNSLTNFILLCIQSEKAKNNIYYVSDGVISTEDILCSVRKGMNMPPLLFYVPKSFMSLVLKLLGREHTYQQLYESLEINNNKVINQLGWVPASRINDNLYQVAKKYNEKN